MIERYLESCAALVTGGATGQGHAIALALAARGCDVAIGSRLAGEGRAVPGVHAHHPTQEEMNRSVGAIEAQGVRAIGADHDLRSNESCAALYRPRSTPSARSTSSAMRPASTPSTRSAVTTTRPGTASSTSI